jgi:hypothetical protein
MDLRLKCAPLNLAESHASPTASRLASLFSLFTCAHTGTRSPSAARNRMSAFPWRPVRSSSTSSRRTTLSPMPSRYGLSTLQVEQT